MTTLSTSNNVHPIPDGWIDRLFSRMALEYGEKFTRQWEGIKPSDMKTYWAASLSGYNGAEIARGLAALDTCDWPPTLPEFKKLCRPTIDPLVAYYEAVSSLGERERGDVGMWSHPAIYWAAINVGSFDMRNQSYSQIKPRWEKALADQIAKGQWRDVPLPLAALAAPGKTLASREEADKRIRELKATDVVKTAASKTDHKAWAKKIIDRQKRGDKSLTMIQIRFAREAMGAA